jgi:hypothetical protein
MRLLPAFFAAAALALPAAATARPQPPAHAVRVPKGAHAAIVGGTAAAPGTFPWLAFVVDNEGDEDGLCSGTVVAANVVLTAGHCILNPNTGLVDPASQFVVATGDVDWTDVAGRQVSGVSQVLLYPGFNASTLYGDAALLVLSTPTTAPAIPLATGADLGLIQSGDAVTIAGWGDTIGGVQSEQTVLQSGTQVTQSPSFCATGDGADGLGFDPTSEFCAIDAPTFASSTCHGDSGGPAIAGSLPGSVVEIGITSRGDPHCSTTVPSIFTRVDLVQPWVAGEIAAVAPAPVTPPPAPAATVTPAPTTPPPTPTPAPTPATPTAPLVAQDGRYAGTSSQSLGRVNVTLGAGGITRLHLQFDFHCTRGKRLRGPFSETSSWSARPIALVAASGLWDFSTSYRDRSGDQYTLSGTVSTPGSAAGTLSISTRNRVCKTGLVHWTATLPS